MNTSTQMRIPTTTEVSSQKISDLFVTAIEGGCHYWLYSISTPEIAASFSLDPDDCWYAHAEVFEDDDFSVTIKPEEDYDSYEIDLDAIHRGFEIMAEKYPQHFKDVVEDNHDAITADVFLQLCTFEEIVYG